MTRTLVLILCLSFLSASRSLGTDSENYAAAFSIKSSDLPGSFSDIQAMGFDLSPDGKQIAVAFRTGMYGKGVGIWLAKWDISTKRLLSSELIDGGLTINQAVNPHAGRNVRYTSNGQIIVVQTGPRVLVLRSDGFKLIQTVEPSRLDSEPKYGPSIAAFDVSYDGRWLVILTKSVGVPKASAGIRLVDLKGDRRDVEWLVQQHPNSVAVSGDGSRIALSGWSSVRDYSADVALLDSTTGEVVKTFQSGCPNTSICGASDARFWGKDRIATVPKPATDPRGHFLATGLRVFDTSTGEMVRELKPQRFSSIGEVVIARERPVLGTINAWETGGEVRRESDFRKSKSEVVLFNLEDGGKAVALRPVRTGQQLRVDQYCLRLSGDASRLALFQGDTVEVFTLEGPAIKFRPN